MELAAICVVLVTCVILAGMVAWAGFRDWQRQQARRIVDIDRTLEPYDNVVIDLRDPVIDDARLAEAFPEADRLKV